MNGLLMQTVHTAARCCAPAAAFGKIAFANFASARYKFRTGSAGPAFHTGMPAVCIGRSIIL